MYDMIKRMIKWICGNHADCIYVLSCVTHTQPSFGDIDTCNWIFYGKHIHNQENERHVFVRIKKLVKINEVRHAIFLGKVFLYI